jgi:hypothetical protein
LPEEIQYKRATPSDSNRAQFHRLPGPGKKHSPSHLKKRPRSRKIFPEFFWRAVFFLFEQAIEIRDVVKTATIAYFGDGVGSID